jgi:DNA-directed RNA polymerase specialized sigma24 family protein
MDDAALLRSAVSDPVAFEQVYRRHAPRLYRWLRKETSDEAALDLVAETPRASCGAASSSPEPGT